MRVFEEALLKVRSAVDALEQRVESAVTSRDASQLRVCVSPSWSDTRSLWTNCAATMTQIRTARKAEVTRIQSLLAQLDAASAGSL
jgi:DNA-binding transcriptional regulator YbjK